MLWIIAIAIAVVLAVVVIGAIAHLFFFLFSPWLLVAIAILAWVKLRPHRTRL
jgi:hypothetical protein